MIKVQINLSEIIPPRSNKGNVIWKKIGDVATGYHLGGNHKAVMVT